MDDEKTKGAEAVVDDTPYRELLAAFGKLDRGRPEGRRQLFADTDLIIGTIGNPRNLLCASDNLAPPPSFPLAAGFFFDTARGFGPAPQLNHQLTIPAHPRHDPLAVVFVAGHDLLAVTIEPSLIPPAAALNLGPSGGSRANAGRPGGGFF
jgi:hypothetical protein